MSTEILHSAIPYDIRKGLPGIQPVPENDWLWVDECYGAQMAYRDQLIAERLGDVHYLEDGALEAGREFLLTLLSKLPSFRDFVVSDTHVLRPDGVQVPIDWDQPLVTAGRLGQADYCILQSQKVRQNIV